MPKLTETLEELLEDHKEREEISLGDVVESFQNRGFGPLLLIPALVAVLPSGAVPGVPTICGIFIALISLQILFGRSHPWIPSWLTKLSLKRQKLVDSLDKIRPVSEKLDYTLKKRLEFFTKGPLVRVVALVVTTLALGMIPLEALPFAVMLPGSAILLFALGLSAKDGLLIAFSLFASLIGALLVFIN